MLFDYDTIKNKVIISDSVASAIDSLLIYKYFKFVAFYLMKNTNIDFNKPFFRTNYPPEWVSYYLLNNLVLTDPVVKHGIAAQEPFIWSDLDMNSDEREIMIKSQYFHSGQSGFTIPNVDSNGRKSLLSLNSHLPDDEWRALIAKIGSGLKIIAQNIHPKGVAEAFCGLNDTLHLSPRERECLEWVSIGKTCSEIAIILELSEHTVRSYLKIVRVKLDSVTLVQAVTKATRMGLI